MDDAFLRELLADHSRNPRNYGELPDPDVTGHADNPQCVGPTHPDGDQVTVQATLSGTDQPVVETVQYTGRGCTLSQATASMLTGELTGTPVAAVLEWDRRTLEELVGMELSPSRLRCAELALVAFRNAVDARAPGGEDRSG
jgi:nitrogen fixation NifU-like protein